MARSIEARRRATAPIAGRGPLVRVRVGVRVKVRGRGRGRGRVRVRVRVRVGVRVRVRVRVLTVRRSATWRSRASCRRKPLP